MVVDENQLIEYGRTIADGLTPGSVVALYGDLGSGKTTLAAAIGDGLGVKERVTSPTFTIINEYYSGRLPYYHFDVYRIGGPAEMYELGYDEYFDGDGVTVVEWADLIEGLLPARTVRVRLAYAGEGEKRVVERP
ncbi:MAG: tRNA (adenosine(37)-N6)-threonylcarbamoyltransferase complex ATPase subunit type 1 TsaE [Clostridiales Family XIII bacterium]|jgi:tRNA threonylcarbamoyladenosine biosynthesis protein TsaE|nr:tRNA (adenosine(37)-N6)-threonylcarbamoyltransferase complex ATPase subunit type 1 TsaE [Clostridiales Family XIII bacterium]